MAKEKPLEIKVDWFRLILLLLGFVVAAIIMIIKFT